MMTMSDTTELILDTAQELVQVHGFNAFSYRDIADRIGIRTASIHYHFPKKDDLAHALIRRYHKRFVHTLHQIGRQDIRPENRLIAYMKLFSDLSAQGERLCLFAVFSADLSSFSAEVRKEIHAFYDTNIDWIRLVLEDGRRTGVFTFSDPSGEIARGIFALLEGEILVLRAFPPADRLPCVPPVVRSLLSWADDRPVKRSAQALVGPVRSDKPDHTHS